MDNKANKIREQRKELAYSVKELATLANIKEKDILDYEANKKSASLKTLEKIANATNTNVSDWVDEVYFRKSKNIENISNEDNIASIFFRAMFRADSLMDTLYIALIDINEIKITEDKEVILSEFCEDILKSISSIKFKKVLKTCGWNGIKDPVSNNMIIEKKYIRNDKKNISLNNETFNNLLYEFRIIFKNIDIIEVIIQALINIGHIDNSGNCSEKATLLLNTVMSNKIKDLLVKR